MVYASLATSVDDIFLNSSLVNPQNKAHNNTRCVIKDVGKFRLKLIELKSFKPKLLIRFIINKPCLKKLTSILCQNHAAEKNK